MRNIRTGFEVEKPWLFRVVEKLFFAPSAPSTMSPLLSKVRNYAHFLSKSLKTRELDYIGFQLGMDAIVGITRFPMLKLHQFTPGRLGHFTRAFTLLEAGNQRAKILNTIYRGFRVLDEVIDRDSPRKLAGTDIQIYFRERLEAFETQQWDQESLIDHWFADLMCAARKLGIEEEIKQSCVEVFLSLEFDAERMARFLETGERDFPAQADLHRHYYELDCLGTGRGMTIIMGEDLGKLTTEQQNLCLDIARATRIYYDIRDLKNEVQQGLVNISVEEAQTHNISLDELTTFAFSENDIDQAPASVQSWIMTKLKDAHEMLERSRTLWGENSPFNESTQILLREIYYPPARKFLDKTAKKLLVRIPDAADSSLDRRSLPPLFLEACAAWQARKLSRSYLSQLEISPDEEKRYFAKSQNLAMLYVGFGQRGNLGEAKAAAKAAFLSCAYDVASDWRNPAAFRETLRSILRVEVSPRLADMALEMFERDRANQLEADGLERGHVSVQFITDLMQVRSLYETITDIADLGQCLQIVDDWLDLPEDALAGDANCFRTERSAEYGQRLADFLTEENIDRFFTGKLMRSLLKREGRKIRALLEKLEKRA